ncbi:MAG: glycosyltransferase family 39 protein [Sedimentisphaerales bacterium]|nr:glycosyltransferase family 39 protein [Sedimentisphaerales bacterium]
MSKHRHKIRTAKKRHETLPQSGKPMSQTRKSALLITLVAALAGIPFALGKHFEFNSPCAFDGGAYVYSAAHILDGAEIGVEEIPSAQLGTLLVNMLGVKLFGFNDFGPKLIQMLLQAGALVLMFIAIRRLFGSILPAAVAVIVASVYLSAPLIAKYGNVKEQYMIAFMIAGASCFVLYELNGKWPLALAAGALASFAPLFKQTGMSVIGAIGLYVVAQPFLKHKTFKQMGRDILLLLAGLALAMAPLYIWILGWDVQMNLPYSFVGYVFAKFIPAGSEAAQAAPDYIGASRKLVSFSEQWPRVLRYYRLLMLPIALALGAIVVRLLRLAWPRIAGRKIEPKNYDRFVLLFAVWWLLDMAFVWISPRSYEQYYLPLNASAAMLGGYLVITYWQAARNADSAGRRIAALALALIAMVGMSWHIFFGITTSPHSGTKYPRPARGYLQKLDEIADRREKKAKGPWEVVGEYIRNNSQPNDKMYVWGWYPGMYVAAGRFSSASKACTLPRPAVGEMKQIVAQLIEEFTREMPKFIVDSRKLHIPTDRPPYVLWPVVPKGFAQMANNGFIPNNDRIIETYDKQWADMLKTRFDEAEALRYQALAPLRKFIRDNYDVVEPDQYVAIKDGVFLIIHRQFSQHVLFQRKQTPKP